MAKTIDKIPPKVKENESVIWDKLSEIFDEHGAQQTIKALMQGMKCIQLENITQEMRLDDFLTTIKENPCQLKLVS
jgi:hypothetical protein